MAGQIYQIQQPKSGFQEFVDAASPYLQYAFQQYMKKKQDEQQQQRNLQQAQQMFPNAFTQTLNAAGQQKYNMDIVSPGMREEAMGQIMPSVPSKYKNIAFNPETAQQYPGLGINFKTGEMEYKVPQKDFISQMADFEKWKSLNGENKNFGLPRGEVSEDWYSKPEMRSLRGVPQQVNVPTRKTQVPREDLSLIKDLDVNISDLESNLQFLKKNPKVKEFLGPGIVQRPGAIADIAAQVGFAPKDFPVFKAKSDLAFQKYRKWVTGVQAGYPELQWIVVDYPKPTDKPDVYISKALSAMEGMKRNREIYLNYLSANNYAVGKLRKISNEQPTQNQSDLSSMSDEELVRIAGGR